MPALNFQISRCLQSAAAGCWHAGRLICLAILPLNAAVPALAQEPVAREVVQPTGSPEVARLDAALGRLAANPQDVAALIESGHAALALDDLDAAVGFFGRAQELAPADNQAKLGMAAAQVHMRQPIEALRLFAQVQQAGVVMDLVAADLGLAHDLVGNNTQAQASYRLALGKRADDEATRRLALSLAISGDRAGFEATLLPLLERRDNAAYRARAFGLAILGDTAEAGSIAQAVMPRDLASRIAPYLAYMQHLTKAQQAAAANLGIFPRAAEIGRDEPQIAQLPQAALPVSPRVPAARADARLAPVGQPLGSPVSRQSVSSAFDSFAVEKTTRPSASEGAVDITAIDAPREVAPKPVQHPGRIWVQVATGVDRNALQFDWRRMARKYADLLGKFDPHVVKWGQANRLLAGPFVSLGDAKALVSALKAKGLDSFVYTSPEGQEIIEIQ